MKVHFFHCFSFSQTMPYCCYRAVGHPDLSNLVCTAVRNQTLALFWVFASCGGRTFLQRGTRWHSWLRHCATSRKVAGSIRDNVNGIFHWHNPSGRSMVLGSTQPRTEMSTRNIFWGLKAAGAKGWQPYHIHMSTVLKSGNFNLLEPSGPVQACNRIALSFYPLHSFKSSDYCHHTVQQDRENVVTF
jgi:hypothetical protein